MRPREYYLIDPQRCHYCSRCLPHTRQQHEEHLARWCDIHHRWCGGHRREQPARTEQPVKNDKKLMQVKS